MKVIITGGAGFIGVNAALEHSRRGDKVLAIDNFSRRGSRLNARLLKSARGVVVKKADVRDFASLKKTFAANRAADVIYHLAAQVAVTSSVENPAEDFKINALGTLNVLEAARTLGMKAPLFFSSTNKVYGGMENEPMTLKSSGWACRRFPRGINENYPVDFHSPYGCSKGAADQYVRDYARIYGMKTVVFRQSCIYGINQFGIEDQGWISHFIIKAMGGEPVTIYGDGHQVRDALYVDDLVAMYLAAFGKIRAASGKIFNAGGGPANAISINSFVQLLAKTLGFPVKAGYSGWRPGDQKFFISDNAAAARILGWKPRVSLDSGIVKVADWVKANRETIKAALDSSRS